MRFKDPKTLSVVGLIAILIFSAYLRFFALLKAPASLFSDEVDIGFQTRSFLETGRDYYGNYLPLQFHSFSDIRTALPIYATILTSRIPGISIDQAIRVTPAVFSLISILIMYFLTNNLFRIFDLRSKNDGRVEPGLITTFLLAITPWFFTYSRTGFELSMLFSFVALGLLLFTQYLDTKKYYLFILSMLVLGLTPAIYSTAKLSVLFIPFLLLTFPGAKKNLLGQTKTVITSVLLFLPLIIIVLSGGAAQRFSEIAIYTDPTLSTQTNFLRQADLGQNLKLGSSPSLVSKIVHNKPLMIATAFFKNLFGPLSTSYLFVAGDPNLRHALPGWGMDLKVISVALGLGIYFALTKKKQSWVSFLLIFVVLSIVPSALTRDGATHSSRLFLLIFPVTLMSAYGIYILCTKKIITTVLILAMLFEASLYFHDYFVHYPVISEREFHAGLKELVSVSNDYKNKNVVLTRTYEPSLIFYLYYTSNPPSLFQKQIKNGQLQLDLSGDLNLEGIKVNGTNVYLASIKDTDAKDPLRLPDTIYVLPYQIAGNMINSHYATKIKDLYMPSGELMYTVILSNPSKK